MLNAFEQGKSKLWSWYAINRGHGDEGERKRITAEDEITSLIFGPLQYLPPKDAAAFWRALLTFGGAKGNDFLLQSDPINANMHFWPKKLYIENGERKKVEPDLLIELTWPDEIIRKILIEIKWDSILSGKDQLRKQWRNFMSRAERDDYVHLFIGKNLSEAEHDRHVLAFSWRHLQEVLSSIRTTHRNLALGQWAALTCSFLGKVILRPFEKFDFQENGIPKITVSTAKFYTSRRKYFPDTRIGIEKSPFKAFYRK